MPEDRSRRRTVRSLIFRIHTWIGLHVCLVLGVIFVTGTLLTLSPELTVAHRLGLYIAPPAVDAPRASLGTLYDTAAAALPKGHVAVIGEAPRPWFGRPVTVGNPRGGPTVLWLDPVDGHEIGRQRSSKFGLRSVIRALHDSLMVPIRPVHVAVNTMSLVLATMLVTGLITYRRFWKGYFRGPSSGMDARIRAGAWHRLVAVWVVPFLSITAITGTVFLFETLGMHPRSGPENPVSERADPLPEGFDGAALDRIVGIAEAALPGFEATAVGLPGRARDPVRVRGPAPDGSTMFGAAMVAVDPVTEEVLGVSTPGDGNTMSTVYPFASQLHFGTWAGGWSEVLWFVFGAASSVLLFTGARVYALRALKARQVDGAEANLPTGTIRVLWQGLGLFRWAYVAVVLVMIAAVVKQAL